MKLYSRRIFGSYLSKRKTTDLIVEVLIKVLSMRKPVKGQIFQSDHCSKYIGRQSRDLHYRHNMRASMGDVGVFWGNAIDERFFRSLKRDSMFEQQQYTCEHVNNDMASFLSITTLSVYIRRIMICRQFTKKILNFCGQLTRRAQYYFTLSEKKDAENN